MKHTFRFTDTKLKKKKKNLSSFMSHQWSSMNDFYCTFKRIDTHSWVYCKCECHNRSLALFHLIFLFLFSVELIIINFVHARLFVCLSHLQHTHTHISMFPKGLRALATYKQNKHTIWSVPYSVYVCVSIWILYELSFHCTICVLHKFQNSLKV